MRSDKGRHRGLVHDPPFEEALGVETHGARRIECPPPREIQDSGSP